MDRRPLYGGAPRTVKTGIDPEERRKRQEETQKTIREQKKAEILKIKREPTSDEDAIRGVTARTDPAWSLFRTLARGDFKHDFGERSAGRDLFVGADTARFFEIAKQVTAKGKVWIQTQFVNNYQGKTMFELVGNGIDTILPPREDGGVADEAFYDEETLLEKVGINYEQIKKDLKDMPQGEAKEYEFDIKDIAKRSYTVRSANYRMGVRGAAGYDTNQNITSMFNTVTGGKNKFVLIVDASGGLPLTELLNSELMPSPAPGSTFYIVENIENASDSATKLSNIKARGVEAVRPNVFFLRDQGNTVVYPLWKPNPDDPKSNIYSSLKIVLNRITDDEIEATLTAVDASGNTTSSITVGDVSNSSNVKNASLRALANFIERGLVPETLAYMLTKRMGDWCQALSMLDMDRLYDVLSSDRKSTGETTTLRELLVDSEVGVVTNDRILLGLSVLLGLNVYYTSAMDLAKLVYFKNNNDLPQGPELEARTIAIYNSIARIPEDTLKGEIQTIQSRIESVISDIQKESDITAYIRKLKSFTSNFGNVRNEFETYINQISESETAYAKDVEMAKFNAANTLTSIYGKVSNDIQHNTEVFANIAIGKYNNSSIDTIRIDALKRKLAAGGRIMKSVEVTEAKNILLTIRDDLKQILGKNIPGLYAKLRSVLRNDFVPPNDRAKSNYDEILTVIPVLQAVVPVEGGQRGGGASDVLPLLQVRSIRLLPEGVEESTSTTNIYGLNDRYIDDKLRPYSISDQYIVTADDMSVFDGYFASPIEQTPSDEYICLKYLLLQCDILKNDIQNITEEPRDNEAAPVEYALYMSNVARLQQIQNGLATGSVVELAHTVYQNNPPDVVGTVSDPTATLVATIRRSIPGPTESELAETIQIETNSKYAYIAGGLYREALASRLAIDLRLNEGERQQIGEAIEAYIRESIVDAAYDGIPIPSTEKINEVAIRAIVDWVSATRPDTDTKPIIAKARTWVLGISLDRSRKSLYPSK